MLDSEPIPVNTNAHSNIFFSRSILARLQQLATLNPTTTAALTRKHQSLLLGDVLLDLND